ncbi:hypothetical protein FB451DRAFT_181900 [Mycena latifolia]|nr:hypothetical protein FB451DRAFT_181900 [Mycena latifolia]
MELICHAEIYLCGGRVRHGPGSVNGASVHWIVVSALQPIQCSCMAWPHRARLYPQLTLKSAYSMSVCTRNAHYARGVARPEVKFARFRPHRSTRHECTSSSTANTVEAQMLFQKSHDFSPLHISCCANSAGRRYISRDIFLRASLYEPPRVRLSLTFPHPLNLSLRPSLCATTQSSPRTALARMCFTTPGPSLPPTPSPSPTSRPSAAATPDGAYPPLRTAALCSDLFLQGYAPQVAPFCAPNPRHVRHPVPPPPPRRTVRSIFCPSPFTGSCVSRAAPCRSLPVTPVLLGT